MDSCSYNLELHVKWFAAARAPLPFNTQPLEGLVDMHADQFMRHKLHLSKMAQYGKKLGWGFQGRSDVRSY